MCCICWLPTTDLLNQYHEALYVRHQSPVNVWSEQPLNKDPGISYLTGFGFGAERYRYPGNLPKVAAKGGPQCTDLPHIPFEGHAPSPSSPTTGTNPFKYGNQYLLWNSELSKMVVRTMDGPPRNTAQIGQPG